MLKVVLTLLSLAIVFSYSIGQNKSFPKSDSVGIYYGSKSSHWVSLRNGERMDGFTRVGDSIYGGEIACSVAPMKEPDLETFKVLAGTSYARDKRYVYYPIRILCVDFVDCGVCYFKETIVKNAKPGKFVYLGKDYATDRENVYFRGELMEDADGKTFKVIEGPEFFYFGVDQHHVFKHDEIFEKADPATFYFDRDDKRTIDTKSEHKYIIGDVNNEWLYVPPDSFKKVRKR